MAKENRKETINQEFGCKDEHFEELKPFQRDCQERLDDSEIAVVGFWRWEEIR